MATDANGAFVLDNLVPGLLYEIRVTAPGLPAVRIGPQPVRGDVAPLEVRVPKPRPLVVVVRDAGTGKPVESVARVFIDDPDLCRRFTASLIRGVRIGPSTPEVEGWEVVR